MADNQNTTYNKKSNLLQKIDLFISELKLSISNPEEFKKKLLEYGEFCAQFHKYSFGNVLLIMCQRPNATLVAGIRKWNKLNRRVRKGEKGISIFAPITIKRDREGNELEEPRLTWKIATVFDISQTEGAELPSLPQWFSTFRPTDIESKLIEFSEKNGIKVSRRNMHESVQGYSSGGAIVLNETAGTATFVHEIAHELLHSGQDVRDMIAQNPSIKKLIEMEAEVVAYIVCKYFGIQDIDEAAKNYLLMHDAEKYVLQLDALTASSHEQSDKNESDYFVGSLKRIHQTSQKIVCFIKGDEEEQEELEQEGHIDVSNKSLSTDSVLSAGFYNNIF